MLYFSEKNYLLFLSIFIIIFLQVIKVFLSNTILNCPKEINNNYGLIKLLMPGNFIRFSQCFYCIGYESQNNQRKLCLFNKTIYEIYSDCSNSFDLSINLTGNNYNLLIINDTKKVDYFIAFIDYNKNINLLHYSFIFDGGINQFIKKRIINNLEIENPKSLSCQIDSFNKQLLCFYIIRPNLYLEIFDINYDFSTINKTNITFDFKNNHNIALKTAIASNKHKIFLCFEQQSSKAFYNYYMYNEHNFKDFKPLNNCETKNQIMETFFYSSKFYFLL